MMTFARVGQHTDQMDSTTATIAGGASVSGAVYLGGYALFGVKMPAAWTAAAISFEVSIDGSDYDHLYDETGTEITFTPEVGATYLFDAASASRFLGAKYIKITSGTASAAVNQGEERALTLLGRAM